ncbi:MAG TPA: TetR/AcrR family transcriptional regulator [Solirubrobacteraceae bacterium]|nr:TetR/AcrR family transcriptional regulator [Solirubrobacteraceae bacterium]
MSASTRPRPPRADAVRTRAALMVAARKVFERDGYVGARIADISVLAGVAHGSFYSHFDGKDDILAAVLDEAATEMLHPDPPPTPKTTNLASSIEAVNRLYLDSYRQNARLMAMMEQVATVDERFRTLRLKRTDAFVARNAALIRRLQEDGAADAALDPELAAMALSAMVSRTAYFAFAVGGTVDFEALVKTVSRLWVNSLSPREALTRPGQSGATA